MVASEGPALGASVLGKYCEQTKDSRSSVCTLETPRLWSLTHSPPLTFALTTHICEIEMESAILTVLRTSYILVTISGTHTSDLVVRSVCDCSLVFRCCRLYSALPNEAVHVLQCQCHELST